MAAESRLVQWGESTLLRDVRCCSCLEKAHCQELRDGRVGMCHGAMDRADLHGVVRRGLQVRTVRKKELEQLRVTKETGVTKGMEAVGRVGVDQLGSAPHERRHARRVPDCARFDDVEIVTLAAEQTRDAQAGAVGGEADHRDAVAITQLGERRFGAESSLDCACVLTASNGGEEGVCMHHIPSEPGKDLAGEDREDQGGASSCSAIRPSSYWLR